jgi:hypothetical protein
MEGSRSDTDKRLALRIALFLVAFFLSLTGLARADQTVIALAHGRHLVVVRPDTGTPAGVVLLIPGGTTLLHLGANGETDSGNFVIRTRSMLQYAGFAIAYMDNPADLSDAIQKLRAVAKPVVLLSTSRGTIVATSNTAHLGPDGPDLLILTSPVTVGSAIEDRDVARVTIPTLVVANTNDSCKVSPAAGAARLASHIKSSTYLTFSSSDLRGDPCEPFSPHGYLGIEVDVLGKIIDWIKSNSP